MVQGIHGTIDVNVCSIKYFKRNFLDDAILDMRGDCYVFDGWTCLELELKRVCSISLL